MRDRATVVIQIMRTFGVCVVSAALSREITFVIDDEVILIEVIVLREIRAGVKFNPG